VASIPEVGQRWRLKRNRGLPYTWIVEDVGTSVSSSRDFVYLRCGERRKRISVRTLRGDYEQVTP
jgi:hypothetical protein